MFKKEDFKILKYYGKPYDKFPVVPPCCSITHIPTGLKVSEGDETVYSINFRKAWMRLLDLLCRHENPSLDSPIWCCGCREVTDSWEEICGDRLCSKCVAEVEKEARNMPYNKLVRKFSEAVYKHRHSLIIKEGYRILHDL